MKRPAFLLLVLLAGCGSSWNLDLPIRLVVDSPEIPATAQVFFADAVSQLGGRVSPTASQVVHIDYMANPMCRGCTNLTVEHVDYHGDTIHFLPRWKAQPADGTEDNLKHGLIHVLGFEAHLDASTRAMMTPLYCDRTDHKNYQPVDIQALCQYGRTTGGICGR